MVERSLGDMDLPRVEDGFERRAGKRPLDRCVEIKLSDRLGTRDRAGVDLEVEPIVGGFAALEVEPGAGRNEVQAVGQRDARIVVEKNAALERRLSREDRADQAGHEALEPRAEIERETAPGALAGDDDSALGPYVLARREIELGREIVERACAVEGELRRRQAGKIDEMDKKAAGRLGGVHIEREPVGRGHVGHERAELARRIEPPRRQAEVEALGWRPQRRLAGDIEARGDAEDLLAQRELLHGELLDNHLDRQFGQDRPRPRRIRRRRGFGGKRAPQKLHMAEREPVDLEAPLEQRKPSPHQPDPVDLHPRSAAIGKDDVADRRVGGEHAVDRADRDAGRGRRQRPRDQVGEHPLVMLGGAGRRIEGEQRRDHRGEQHRHGSGDAERKRRHQKACPMLT